MSYLMLSSVITSAMSDLEQGLPRHLLNDEGAVLTLSLRRDSSSGDASYLERSVEWVFHLSSIKAK